MHLGRPGFSRQSTLGSPVLAVVGATAVVAVVTAVAAAAVEVDRSRSRCVTGGFLVKKNGILRVVGAVVVGGVVGVVVVVELCIDVGAGEPGAGRQPWHSDPPTQPAV